METKTFSDKKDKEIKDKIASLDWDSSVQFDSNYGRIKVSKIFPSRMEAIEEDCQGFYLVEPLVEEAKMVKIQRDTAKALNAAASLVKYFSV